MDNICLEKYCTGCCSCLNICSQNAINMVENDIGTIIPRINSGICIDCNRCKQACPQNTESVLLDPYIVFAAWAKDKADHVSSSSGGVASVFYKNIVSKYSGICVGSAFKENLFLNYQIAETIEDLYKFKGSKYVQSYIGNIYFRINEYLKYKPVIFIGTPCQVDGLKVYLNGNDF